MVMIYYVLSFPSLSLPDMAYPFYIRRCVGFFVLFWERVEKKQNEVKMQAKVEQPYFRG